MWISVKDRLPDNQDNVFIVCMDNISEYGWPYEYNEACDIAFYSNQLWWQTAWAEKEKEDNIIEDVTHWQPLPEPPEE